VSGRVQGVFFRDSTRKQAREASVSGWVRNRSDATVEAVFEGDEAAVERMIEFCRAGPDRADVRDVDVTGEEPEGLSGFELR
jgi:acylphosphatase